jgi:hypothetical protein
MTPTSFAFTLTMPGDVRLVGAIRQLTAHAAGYAQLSAEAGAALTGHVGRAAEAAVKACLNSHASIELRFSADAGVINVHIACDAAETSSPPRSTKDGDVTVDWSKNGSRHLCHIRQRSPS